MSQRKTHRPQENMIKVETLGLGAGQILSAFIFIVGVCVGCGCVGWWVTYIRGGRSYHQS